MEASLKIRRLKLQQGHHVQGLGMNEEDSEFKMAAMYLVRRMDQTIERR